MASLDADRVIAALRGAFARNTGRTELLALAERTGVQELMILTSTFGHKDRLRSYELLADVLPPAA